MSIKVKFSIFIAVLLLLTVLTLSLLVLTGIQKNQQMQVEDYLAQQAETANFYLLQSILTESNKVPRTFLADKGAEFARQLELITGRSIAIYNMDGTLISRNPANTGATTTLSQTLSYALNNKTAYLIEQDALYYMAPLQTGNEQIGVVQIYYSLRDNQTFYNGIKQLFISIGAAVFVLSFIIAYAYFNTFAGRIIKLKQMVGFIREGNYQTHAFAGKDEIGELSRGIRDMGLQIKTTIEDKDKEREKLALAVDKLSLLDRQQKQFIGNVTHEFKTPLTSIKAYLDLLDMYKDDAGLLDTSIASIASETERLYEMVEKVLNLSALEKYEFEYNKESVNVKQYLQTVLNSLQGKIDKFGILLETDLQESYITADKDSLIIVLVNLLDNAIKYNKPHGHIKVANYERDGCSIVEIADSGIGIPPEVSHKIFDPFYTVDKNRARQYGGSGLGLTLAKKYAEIQGGHIELSKTDSSGTVFKIIFPVLFTN